MKNINIKALLGNGEMVYDTLFNEGSVEWFKSSESGYIYVFNTESKRCTRYNAEAQNGKRVPASEYESEMANAIMRSTTDTTYETHEEMMQEIFDESYERRQEMAREEEERAKESDKQAEEAINGKTKKRAPRTKAAWKMSREGGLEIALTEKQVDFIKHLPDTCFWENGIDSEIWIDVLCDEITGQFEGKPMTIGAMVSTLREKGLVRTAKQKVNGRTAQSLGLTELGKIVAKELGL